MTRQRKNVFDRTFEEFSTDWLAIQKPQLKPSSIAKYENIMELYLLPGFGKRKMRTISRKEVVVFSRELLISGGTKSKGLEPKTVNSILSVMKNIFGYAAQEKCVVADIKDISVKQPQKPMRILSVNEQRRLSRHLCDNPTPCHLGILLCLYTGLRIGEVCALKWEDICIGERYLYVHQAMQRIHSDGKSGKKTEVVIQPPKSDCSVRKIPIPDKMIRLLVSTRKEDGAFLLTGTEHSFIDIKNALFNTNALYRKTEKEQK